ncbi:hypothetical protein G8E10_25130 [Rhizobiaceae bacterium CRRU44]|uniref:Uncharacterized protein n=1 Tax=Ferranicluibacter rubi TaxID=2715133 RepID=A0AA43ZJH6_9HYPH|nr:Atu4866 domain-containing protein [Ferranicluibacter rubi]NHT78987.1 hypothetical protein [Ferranicluibacter rubi]PYE31713.1 putative ligand-binding protein with streptavidin-like fold [Rhizobium sp. PP-WC-1G-195]
MSDLILIIATAASLGALAHIAKAENTMSIQSRTQAQPQNHVYLGMWVTDDGHIRQELLPTGRYNEARGNRQSAYQGCYVVTSNHIDYWDDMGFTADGTFVDQDTLQHGGMIFYREKP